ncbi:multidrug effflux MFS transporter [Marinomonas epiphytica]
MWLKRHLPEKEFITLFAIITSLTALSIDAMLPAFPSMANDLGVTNYQQTQWIISALIFGMMFGELLFGPLSDAIGRKSSILIGVGIYIVGSLIAMSSTSLTMLLVGRVIQGFGVSAPKIASRALIRDLYKGAAMARIMSYVMVIFILVPMLAPAFGQFVLSFGNWHWIFGVLIIQALFASSWLMLRQQETLDRSNRKPLRVSVLLNSAKYILARKDVVAYTGIAGLIFAGLMLYLSIAQSIFQDIYQLGKDFPLYFAMLALGSAIANLLNARIVQKVGMTHCVSAALFIMFTTAVVLTVFCIWFDGVPPLALFIGAGMLMFACLGMVFGNINALAMEPLGKVAGLAASMISSCSSFIAIIGATIIGQFYHLTVTPLALGFALFSGGGILLLVYANRYRRRLS